MPDSTPIRTVAKGLLILVACVATLGSASVAVVSAASKLPVLTHGAAIRIGAVFPLRGATAASAAEQLNGIRIAAQVVQAQDGVAGHPIEILVRDLERPGDARATVRKLRDEGASLIVGSYSSDLSIAVSRAAAREGLVYWEAGAVADRLTGRGLAGIYRVGASGTNLGEGSARFVATQLAPRLGIIPGDLRVALVAANDDYAQSVADAAQTAATDAGMAALNRFDYPLLRPDFEDIVAALQIWHPDVIILASHIPDGIAFRRAMLAAGLRVGAFIGSTMAQCGPTWGSALQEDAIGTFASDRPTGGFDPAALDPAARVLYDELASAWGTLYPGRAPSEDGLSGFSAGWALFHEVLPAAVALGGLGTQQIIQAASAVDLPVGSLPDGAGLRFSTDPDRLGQNERAAAVIWQWQAVERSVTVWPPAFANGTIGFVPLPR